MLPKMVILGVLVGWSSSPRGAVRLEGPARHARCREAAGGHAARGILRKKAKAVNYDLYVAQLKDVEQSFGALVKQLPNRSEIDALLTDVNQAGLGRGLVFELFRPAPQEKMAEFYAELPIAISITGNYHDMGAFASDVAQLPRIVTLNDVSISNNKGQLKLDATAKTFRYLDEDELAQSARGGKRQRSEEMKRHLVVALFATAGAGRLRRRQPGPQELDG